MDRRSFMQFGRAAVLPTSVWETFCQRVQRSVRATVRQLKDHEQGCVAEVTIERPADSKHILALCREYQVSMILAGSAPSQSLFGRDCLIVQLGSGFRELEHLGSKPASPKRVFLLGTCMRRATSNLLACLGR